MLLTSAFSDSIHKSDESGDSCIAFAQDAAAALQASNPLPFVSLDFVWWHYIDHQTHERVDVFDSTLVFMKKLILHIPDDHFKMVRYLAAYTSRKKKLCRCIQKMLRKPRAWIRKKLSSYREFRKESTGIDPFLCSCGHIMEFVESFFPAGLEVKINETWELYDWHRELDPLQVY